MNEAAITAAEESIEKATKSLDEKKTEMGDSHLAAAKIREEFSTFFRKLKGWSSSLEKLRDSAKTVKEKASRRAVAMKKDKEENDCFDKFDEDTDGKLNRTEALAFAKAVYSFEPDSDQLDRMFRSLATGDGITLESFHRLRAKVAILKSEIQARQARAERPKRTA